MTHVYMIDVEAADGTVLFQSKLDTSLLCAKAQADHYCTTNAISSASDAVMNLWQCSLEVDLLTVDLNNTDWFESQKEFVGELTPL